MATRERSKTRHRGPASVGPLYLSASGIDRFTSCENKWLLHRDIGESDIAPSDPLRLGTLLHRLVQAFLGGGDWEAEWHLALADEDGWEPGFEEPEIFKKATWIMERYVAHYGPPSYEFWGAETEFNLPLDRRVQVHGYMDGLALIGHPEDGHWATGLDDLEPGVYVWEVKSMGRWGREERVAYDPQLGLYMHAARNLGYDIKGAVFDALSTYKYKGDKKKDSEEREEPALAKSFKRIAVPYDQRFVDHCLDNARRIAKRVDDITKNPLLAVRAVGDQCRYCPFHVQCLKPWELEAA